MNRVFGESKDYLYILECGDECETTSDNIEVKLKTKLFCHYDKYQRPVKNHKNTTITVRLRYIVRSFDYVSIQGSKVVKLKVP